MQDRYTGDIGDYGKYTLIRALLREHQAKGNSLLLGVNWYRAEPEANGDGQILEYLDGSDELEMLDPELFDFLRGFRLGSKERNLSEVENSGGAVFPDGTNFFSEVLSLAGLPKGTSRSTHDRTKARAAWHGRSLEALKEADLVFLDPDNGIELPSVPIHLDKASKYVYEEEIEALLRRGQSVLYYQHQRRNIAFDVLLRGQLERFRRSFEELLTAPPEAVVFNRRGARAFLLLPAGDAGPSLRSAFLRVRKALSASGSFRSVPASSGSGRRRRLSRLRSKIYFSWIEVDRAAANPEKQAEARSEYRHTLLGQSKIVPPANTSCPACGQLPKDLDWVWVESPEDTWTHLCGRAGWLSICRPCGLQVEFRMTVIS
jgi:hypothetical protein